MGKAKNIKLIDVLLIIVLIILGISGCSSNSSENSERYGVNITEKKVVSVKDIYTNPVELPLVFAKKNINAKNILDLLLLKEVNLEDKEGIQIKFLSGGDKQRTGIARALINDPKILIADEPTGKLESKVSLQIFELFERLSEKGLAIFIATHDLELAQATQRIIHLQDGKIVPKEKSDLYY